MTSDTSVRDKVLVHEQKLDDFIENQSSTNERLERDLETIKQSLTKLVQSEVKFELLLKTQEGKTDKIGLLGTGLLMIVISAIVNFISSKLTFGHGS